MNIIAITGKAGSGKDTIAQYLCSRYLNTYTESFAAPLKRACAEAFGIPLEDFHSTIRKELTNPLWGVSPRKIAQFVGTEMFRESLKNLIPGAESFWVNRMSKLLAGQLATETDGIYDSDDNIVIPDLRFQNEYEFVASNSGIIIHLTKPGADGTVGIPNHISEAGIEFTHPHKTYYLHNDSSLEALYGKVEFILTQAKLPHLFYNQITAR